jgi:hypothetical protein
MAYTKPSGVNSLWAASGDKTPVPPAKVSAGWVAEKPSFQYFNQILYNLGSYDAYSNERGIPEWDSVTEYQANKSYVVGSDGNVYKCLVTDDNVDPTIDDGTNWLQVWNNQGVVKWNLSTAYTESAIVRHTDGESYICHTSQTAGTLPTDHSAFINLRFFGAYAYAVSQIAGGDASLVGFIYIGQTVDTFDYLIYPADGRIYARGSVTGTITGTFDPVAGTASGLDGALIQVDAITEARVSGIEANKLDKSGVQKVTGTATFTKATNNINLTNIGLNREVGDVIDLSGSLSAAASNDPYFTIEEITDLNNVIVNKAHANGTTSKSLIDETLVGAIISLVSKWNVAELGLGQGWVQITRVLGVPYLNETNRTIKNNLFLSSGSADIRCNIDLDGTAIRFISHSAGTGPSEATGGIEITAGTQYILSTAGSPFTITQSQELR